MVEAILESELFLEPAEPAIGGPGSPRLSSPIAKDRTFGMLLQEPLGYLQGSVAQINNPCLAFTLCFGDQKNPAGIRDIDMSGLHLADFLGSASCLPYSGQQVLKFHIFHVFDDGFEFPQQKPSFPVCRSLVSPCKQWARSRYTPVLLPNALCA